MGQGNDKNRGGQQRSPVTTAFLENRTFLQRFLTRFFTNSHDIEDVTQEAFLRAYIAEQQKDIDQPKAYLFRVAKNVALTKLTTKSAQITDYIEECGGSVVIEASDSVDVEVEAEETLGLYCEAVAALPSKCREVYLFRKVHGLAYKEIADRMNLSVSSVEKYMLKGMLECRDYVDRREGKTSVTSGSVKYRPGLRYKDGT